MKLWKNRTPAHCVCVDCEEGWPYEERLQAVIVSALNAEGVDVPCVVEVCITDDEGIHQTNLEMRGVDRPTDVLSFPMFELSPGEKPRAEWADPDTDKVFLGDMMLSLERAEEQAAEYGHSLERELCYLAVHSVLHLLGYDHLDEGAMRAQMRGREEAILGALGITRDSAPSREEEL
ncbi:MAG: rRNA maturation RNase YbeY [Lawsonibacter sp.]